MNKTQQLTKIEKEIAACKICKKDKTGLPVPGEGNPDAEVVFIGEAPGKTEAKTGRPFVGRSGKFLRLLIQKIGLREEDVFITSPVKYLPLRGTPTKADILHGRIHLEKQLAVIQPKILVLLGSVAAQALLDEPVAVLKNHGTIQIRGERTYFLTIHPAAAIRFSKFREIIASDFAILQSLLI